jgi:hypothetical protein
MTVLLVLRSERPLVAPRDAQSSREAVADRRREARGDRAQRQHSARRAAMVIRVPGAFGAARSRRRVSTAG